jgi:hypothetical protein
VHTVTLHTVPALIGLIGLSAFAEPPSDEVLAHAQERFRLGVESHRNIGESRRRFAEAADDLARLTVQGYRSPALWLARGNAEALAGRWPLAIWAYQCGRRRDRNDAALRAHLDYARSLVNYPANGRGRPTSDPWPGWLHRPSTGQWLVAAAVAYGLACLAGGGWYLRRRGMPMVALLFALALAASVGYFTDVERARYDRDHPLLVLGVETTLHRGNGASYPLHPDVPSLPAGLEVRLLHRRGEWLQVQLAGGETGWAPAAAVLVVE